MPLSLAVAGLNPQQKAALAQSLRSKADDLTTTWTLYWEPEEYPSQIDALLYFVDNTVGMMWQKKMQDSKKTILIALHSATDSNPSSQTLFVRMPFDADELVKTLNTVAKKIKMQKKWQTAEIQEPKFDEHVELQFTFQGASRVNRLTLYVYALFEQAEKGSFYKIKSKKGDWEMWCFPDIGYYWCTHDEDQIWSVANEELIVYRCPERTEAIKNKHALMKQANELLWQCGFKAYKTSEVLPFLQLDSRMHLKSYPNVPVWARTPTIIKALLFLGQKDMSLPELLSNVGTAGRKEVCQTLNALLMCGCLIQAQEPFWEKTENKILSAEEQIFYRSVCLKIQEERK